MKKYLYSLIAAILLSACADDGSVMSGQKMGAIAGGIGGALVGSSTSEKHKTEMTLVGGLVGALLGGEVGRYLDNRDKKEAAEAQTDAFNAAIGETVEWANSSSGNSGSFTPVSEYKTKTGDMCRKYEILAYAGGETQKNYKTLCE